MEAHGGYTFCGVAALVILKKEQLLNLRSLLVSVSGAAPGCWDVPVLAVPPRSPLSPPQHWVASRQMRFEGGFQGRCNKLVDGCYSFWQAGLLPLLHHALHAQGELAWGGHRLRPLPNSGCGEGRKGQVWARKPSVGQPQGAAGVGRTRWASPEAFLG